MRSVHVDQIEWTFLEGRSVKVLTEKLPARNLTIGIVELPPGSKTPPHHHIQEELSLCLEGRGYLEISGERVPVQPGTLVHLPSNEEHYTVNESDHEVLRFIFCFSPPVIVGSYG